MNTLRIFNDKARYIAIAAVLLLTLVIPVLASADQVTERSIELSSATVGAASTTYQVKFKAVAAAGAFVVDFCTNSPLIGQTCNAPGGMVATAADSATVGVTDVTGAASKFTVTKPITAGEDVDVVVTGITNPSAAGTVYARIVTYDNGTNAANYASNDLGTGNVDDGSVALAFTDNISVSGDVLESLSFCVSGASISNGCVVSTDPEDAPTLKLGKDLGNGVIALDPSEVSTKPLYTQISTNAVGGAIVSLKSSTANCGGLVSAGPAGCGIKPADSTVTPVFDDATGGGKALFGVKTATSTGGDGSFSPLGSYGNSNYFMNFTSGANPSTGVTSTYGDQFLSTEGAPALNRNMTLTFGASAANNTPAGSYSANISLIATGTF